MEFIFTKGTRIEYRLSPETLRWEDFEVASQAGLDRNVEFYREQVRLGEVFDLFVRDGATGNITAVR